METIAFNCTNFVLSVINQSYFIYKNQSYFTYKNILQTTSENV